MQRTDRLVGIGLALLALVVLWTARAFPDVPGQKLGAAFLPLPKIISFVASLILCVALALYMTFSDTGKAMADTKAGGNVDALARLRRPRYAATMPKARDAMQATASKLTSSKAASLSE